MLTRLKQAATYHRLDGRSWKIISAGLVIHSRFCQNIKDNIWRIRRLHIRNFLAFDLDFVQKKGFCKTSRLKSRSLFPEGLLTTRGKCQLKHIVTIYPKVASRSTCYYSGNQKFCILKSQLLTSF